MDVACQMPPLEKPTRSFNNISFFHAYTDVSLSAGKAKMHFGCGVHFILAQMSNVYLNTLLQDACLAGSTCKEGELNKDRCASGFKWTLEQAAQHSKNATETKLTNDERCQIEMKTYLAFESNSGFPAFVEESSHWQFGADKPGKFGWIANEIPSILSKETEGREKKSARSRRKALGNYPFDQLSATDIVFLELNSVTKEGQFIFGLGNLLIRESLADFRVDIRHMFPKNDLFLNLEEFCNFYPTEH